MSTFYPNFRNQFIKNNRIEPVFITCDKACLQYVQKCKGLCLYCSENIDTKRFNFSDLYQREVWILYSDDKFQYSSIQLAWSIQRSGAKKIRVVPFPIFTTQEQITWIV